MSDDLLQHVRHIHLVGISGIGMNGLACLLHARGYRVTGSDLKQGEYLAPLLKCGVGFFKGHSAANISDTVDLVCYSSAVQSNNPELVEARRRNVSIIKRAELLAELTKDKTVLAVAGSHGKTTTTALLSHVLQSLGYEPSVFIGGVSLNYDQIAWWGKDIFIVEVDESDGSFLCFKPDYAIITNVDKEHLDYYRDEAHIKDTFAQFIGGVKRVVVGCGDDHNTRSLLENSSNAVTYGLHDDSTVYADNIRSTYSGSRYNAVFAARQRTVEDIFTPLLGTHNVLNSLGVLTLLESFGIDPFRVKDAFARFKGTKRRFQVKEVVNGTMFVDDYAHHPSEIRATLSSARFFNRRVVAIFEPHRYSRFAALSGDFKQSFDHTDVVIVTDVYAASEHRMDTVNVERFCKELEDTLHKPVYFIPDGNRDKVASLIEDGDIVVGLGAGRISEVLDDVIRGFKEIKPAH